MLICVCCGYKIKLKWKIGFNGIWICFTAHDVSEPRQQQRVIHDGDVGVDPARAVVSFDSGRRPGRRGRPGRQRQRARASTVISNQ